MEQKFYKKYKITSLKFWQNYWEYYKLHTIAVLFVVILTAVGVRSCMNKVDIDLNVMYVGEYLMPMPEKLEAMLKESVKDVDGDGKVTINISNDAYSGGKDVEAGVAIFNKIDAELMAGDPFILMTDEVYIGRFENTSALQPIEDIIEGKDIPEENIKRDSKTGAAIAVDVSNMPIGMEVGALTGKKIYVGIKVLPKDKMDNEKYVELFEESKNALGKMLEYEK